MALAAFLPFARGAIAGHSFYFRDLSLQFFPVRRYVVEGLRLGTLRYWNPFTHEGEALSLPPVGYLPDLLQMPLFGEAGFSLLLALHVCLAGVALFLLLRDLEVAREGAAAGGLVYALGGFALSTVNLYVYVQALAWAPLLVRGLRRAAAGGSRDVAWAAVFTALALSTTGVEIAGQAVLAGVVLAAARGRAGLARIAASLLLGVLLAAPVWSPVAALVGSSARRGGLPTEVALSHSVHPVTLLQTVVGNLYGDMAHVADRWWGQNFFPRGFPYFLSLYLGATVVALALAGLAARPRPGRLLAMLGALALVVAVGQFAGLGAVVEHLPALRRFRYPSKAFFTVHLVAALLCGFGVHEIAAGARRARRAAAMALGAGAALLAAVGLAAGLPGLRRFLLGGFFPPDLPWALREAHARAIVSDAAAGAAIALAVGAVALLGAAGRLPAARAALLTAALVAADLLRTGAGLNPMVGPGFFQPSADAVAAAAEVNRAGGRLFILDPGYDPGYYAARAARASNHEVWSFAVLQETFVPDFNLRLRVSTAFSQDRSMLVPEARVLPPAEAGAAALPGLVDRLRAAAVSHVLAVRPLDHPALELARVSAPARVAPLAVHLYRLRGSRPRWEIAGAARVASVAGDTDWIEMDVEATSASELVLREALGPGWTASLDGRPVQLVPHEDRYWKAPLPAGRSRLRLQYRPPGLRAGLAAAGLAALAVAALLARGSRLNRAAGDRPPRPGPPAAP